MDKLKLNIITPQKQLFSEDIDMVTIPGSMGEFAILPSHINMISTLNIGIINIYKDNMIVSNFYILSGFLENSKNICNILTSQIFDIKDLRLEYIEKRLEDLSLKLDDNASSISDEITILKQIKAKIKKIN